MTKSETKVIVRTWMDDKKTMEFKTTLQKAESYVKNYNSNRNYPEFRATISF